MNDRLQRLEFFSLYELYLQKNEEFRNAVNTRQDPQRLEALRESIRQIFSRLSEKRGYVDAARLQGQHAP